MKNEIQTVEKCIIIGAGNCDVTHIDLQDGDICIAADNGFAYCESRGIKPDFIIGDFDSVSPKLYEKIQKIEQQKKECVIHLPKEKDDTDMMAAIRLGLQYGYQKFCLYGALGGQRFEHSLANIQCLQFLKNQGAEGTIIEKHQTLSILKRESIILEADKIGYVSVFALSETAEVSIHNMKYELTDTVITNDFPIGISNELIGKPAEISVKNGTILLILSEKM